MIRSATFSPLFLLLLLSHPVRAADSISPKDRQVIITLIERLKEQKDIRFIRLNKSYDSKTAAWYLRYKWDHNKDKVRSIEDFISLSSTGGENNEITYYVQYPDGKRETAHDALEASLKKIRDESPPQH